MSVSSPAPPPILHAYSPSIRELIFRLIHCVQTTENTPLTKGVHAADIMQLYSILYDIDFQLK